MKTELLGDKIKDKIEFLEDEKETQGMRREIFNGKNYIHCSKNIPHFHSLFKSELLI
jgi:hypothetical protein